MYDERKLARRFLATGGRASRSPTWTTIVTIPEPAPMAWRLPAAELHERTDIEGGIRTLHELAVAIAATGRRVELRGPVSRPVLDALVDAAAARPALPCDSRRPGGRDIVVNIDGEHDPLRFARYLLSPARLVVALLAPPGLTGWPFVSQWRLEPYLTVALDSVARPEHFRAMAALGLDVWTHMQVVHERAREGGLRSSFIGSGDPRPAAEPTPKDVPVVYVHANRWRPLVERVADRLPVSVRAIPAGSNESIAAALARAQVLLLPARVEGDGRLLREARGNGAIVVALASNRYGVGLDESCGAVAVGEVEQIPAAVEALLADPERLARLEAAGRRSVREQVDWSRYLERVDAAVAAVEDRPEDAAVGARAVFGERIDQALADGRRAVARVAELDEHLADAARRIAELERELAHTSAPCAGSAAAEQATPAGTAALAQGDRPRRRIQRAILRRSQP